MADGCFEPWAGKALKEASLSQLGEQVSITLRQCSLTVLQTVN